MSSRKIVHLDYAELNRTGRKVIVERKRVDRKTPKMGDKDLQTRALDISSDVADLFESYDLKNMEDIGELNEFVSLINETKREYRRVHTQLETVEGEAFATKYPEYDGNLKMLTDLFKEANQKLRDLKKQSKVQIGNLGDPGIDAAAVMRLDEKRLQCLSEHKFFVDQAFWELDECDWENLNDIEDVKSQMSLFENRLGEFFRICSNLKGYYGVEYNDLDLEANNVKLVDRLREKVNFGKVRSENLKREKLLSEQQKREADEKAKADAEAERIKDMEHAEKERIKNLLVCAEGLKFEIKNRHDRFKSKCSIDFSNLNDYEVLDIKKREESFHVELREIFDKISSFERDVLPCGDAAAEMRKNVLEMRESSSKSMDLFLVNLSKVVADRDISEKKLKNSAGLKIELGKFKGYNSDMDIYTFKSEFSKLVEPEIKKGLWADVLKRNYLAGSAQNLVSKIDDIAEIWKKLTEVYGDSQILLHNKISSLKKLSNLEKLKDDEKIAHSLTSLLNMMADLSSLAGKYDLEGDLYHGGGLERVLDLLGVVRERKFIKSISKSKLKNKEKWVKLVEFLREELSEREAYVLNNKSKKSLERDKLDGYRDGKNPKDTKDPAGQKRESAGFNSDSVRTSTDQNLGMPNCSICGKSEGHVVQVGADGTSRIEYISCKTFVEMKAKARDSILFKKRLCSKCLKPGAKYNSDHGCHDRYACNKPFKNKKGEDSICKKHVLVCGFHCDEKSNQDLLEVYKKDLIKNEEKFKDFFKNVAISCFSESYSNRDAGNVQESDQEEESIFQFQDIDAGDEITGNVFFDNGCGKMCIAKRFKDRLEAKGRATCVYDGLVTLRGAADQVSSHEHGIWKIKLRLANGEEAVLEGLCVDSLTAPFPKYKLKAVEKDFRDKISKINPKILGDLPTLPVSVGGEVDLMIGKQYLKYSPREVAHLESGLTLYRSKFKNPDGTVGVISGPHPEFTKTNRLVHFAQKCCYSVTVQQYLDLSKMINEVPLLGYEDPLPYEDDRVDTFAFDVFASSRGPRCLKPFEDLQETGTVISYRCLKCRNCLACKNASRIDDISLQGEAEQNVIDNSIEVDHEDKHEATGSLPFIANPQISLAPTNYPMSRKVYNSVVKSLSKDPQAREDTIKAEGKLHKLGYVQWVDDLSDEDRKMILESPVKYIIPWRVVWNNSMTTPVRPVFDASQRGPNGCSLNDILAKGSNNMNNLVIILLRWVTHIWAYHTDIRTMYNRVKLLKPFWCYQLYLWEKDLDPSKEPLLKVIKTLIYGVRSSGNQAERAIRLTAEKNKDKFPAAYNTIHYDTYVDDVISGEDNEELGMQAIEELEQCLLSTNFTLKGVTVSGKDPDESLSADKESVMVGGYKWFPKGDDLMVNIDPMNFARKVRGRKDSSNKGIPDELTMVDCAGKVAEFFEPYGRFIPLVTGWRLDISHLQRTGLSWGDKLPDNLRGLWVSHVEMMQEISQIRFKRAVVPLNAKSLDIRTLDAGDGSPSAICAAIYVRFELTDGSYSCQLVFARSKILPQGVSVPRAELMAAHLNAATGHTVKKAFGDRHKSALKLTDSTVALHWICSNTISLKAWARARVIETRRLSTCGTDEALETDESGMEDTCPGTSNWVYVESGDMVADIGTRRGAKLEDVLDGSDWVIGKEWMRRPESEFPVKTLDEINMTPSELDEANKEKIVLKTFFSFKSVEVSAYSDEQTKLRYKFSNYLLDPNKYRFRKVVRVLSLVLFFIKKVSKNSRSIQNMKIFTHQFPGKFPKVLESDKDRFLVVTGRVHDLGDVSQHVGRHVEVTDEMLMSAMYYYSQKSSLELKHFLDKKKFVNITREIDEVLYYSGRLLNEVSFEGYPELCQEAIDLCPTSFCVPVMDRYSPVAISIALEIHWHHDDVRHTGIENMLRQTESMAHIIGGRKLVKSIKEGCKKCRTLNKEGAEVLMGPLQNVNLCIAPAFFACQCDILGPYKAYSPANKRATLKVWFTIYCCCTTGAVDIRIMEDYSTDSFVSGFIRFSCRFGYPKYVLPDYGSQLVKGCEEMTYSFTDVKQKLSIEHGVDFRPCPVGAHYVHGKVERKIREIKKCVDIRVHNERLSILQWETLMQQVSNSINNHPLGLKHYTTDLENLDLITPNRLILGRNNDRCPNSPLTFSFDHKQLIQKNADIFRAWFKAWLVSYLPSLIERPKWHKTDREMQVGDVVLFLKSEREFDEQYQYGIVSATHKGQDGHVRKVDVDYKNATENVRRTTCRGVRELVVIYPIDELDIYERLNLMID